MKKKSKGKHSSEKNAQKNIVNNRKQIEEKNISAEKKVPKIILKTIIFIVFLCIFIFASFNFLKWIYHNVKEQELNKELSQIAFSSTETEVTKTDDGENEEEKKVFNLDELKQINSDVVGWINIDGTKINYPIVQTKDNDYYLHKDFNKKDNICGSIFMDWKNSDTFIDRNTVIFGHNIKSGMMFADLTNIYNGSLGNEIYINIYANNQSLKYKVFSSYMTDPEDYGIKSGIVKADEEEKYIKEMLRRSTILYNVVPDKEDKLLTLSTCDRSGQKRILVHASLVEKQEY